MRAQTAQAAEAPGLLERIDGFFRAIPGDSANPVDIMLKNQHFMLTPTPTRPTGINGFSTGGPFCITATWTCPE